MDLILAGFSDILTLTNILYIGFGVSLGIFIGAIPGLAAPMVMAMLTPLTFYMNPLTAISFLLGMLKGGYYGGSISAILLNTPGTPDAAAACFDGYPLAQQGKAEKALKMSLYSSVFGDTLSDVILIIVAAPIAGIALKMGPPEITALIIFAMTMMSSYLGESFIKGLIAAALGMFLATVGIDPELAQPRLTFGLIELEEGFPITAMFIGILALGEIILQLEGGSKASNERFIELKKDAPKEDRVVSWREFSGTLKTQFRSTGIGTVIGALPGLGATLAAFLAYGAAKRTSKNPEEFGHGSLEGLAAAEAGNNATCGANLIPLFSLGIPGNVAAALLIGVFMIHGVNPGPLMFEQDSRLIYGIFGAIIVANGLHLIIGYIGLRFFTKILNVNKEFIYPLVVLSCMTGIYMANNSLFHVGIMVVFGWLGYFMKKLEFSFITFIIGFVLGPIMEHALNQSVIMGGNSPLILIQRPISLSLLVLTFLYVGQIVYRSRKEKRSKKRQG